MFIRLFARKNTQPKETKDHETFSKLKESSCTQSTASAGSSRTLKKKKKKASKKKKEEEKPDRVRMCEEMFDKLNHWKSKEDFLSVFASPEVKIVLEDGMCLQAAQLAQSAEAIILSCPDAKFSYESVTVLAGQEAAIEGIVVSGTHTKEPYTPMPGMVPPLTAEGKHFILDEERDVVKVDPVTNKIVSIYIYSLGTHTGPVGVYEVLGGTMPPPPPPTSS